MNVCSYDLNMRVSLKGTPPPSAPRLCSGAVRIALLHFQARGHKRRPNLALVFCVHFMLQYLCVTSECVAFVVRFSTKPRDWPVRPFQNDQIYVERDVKLQLRHCKVYCSMLCVLNDPQHY